MPTVIVKRKELFERLGKEYSKEFPKF